MDFIRQQLTQLQERLAGLSPSQKMLSAALVVIAIMTLLYWSRFASSGDTVALFPAPLQSDELTKVSGALTARGIPFRADGGLVKVAAERQMDAMSAVAYSDALPASAPNAFETMLKQLSPLDSRGAFNARMKMAREATLAQMIKLGDPAVRTAMVMITEGEPGGLVRAEPRVNVTVSTNGQGNRARIAQAAFSLATNGVIGTKRENITVAIDGSPVSQGPLAFGSADMLELKSKYQDEAAARIRDLYYYIPGLRVMVNAEVDAKTTHEISNTVDPQNKISMTTESVSTKTTSTEPGLSGEPGVEPNVGLDARGGVSPMAGSTSVHTEERNEVAYGKKQTEVSTPGGAGKITSVSIRVPSDYWEMAAQKKLRVEKPSAEQVEAFASAQIEQMRTEIRAKVMEGASEDAVTVSEYVDVEEFFAGRNGVLAAGAGATSGGLTVLAKGHAKEVAVGLLALTSLFMVGRMVRKSAPIPPKPPEPATPLDGGASAVASNVPLVSAVGSMIAGKKRGPRGTLDGSFDLAGDVVEGGPVMMGRELDDEVLETSQMVDQVASFVTDNPDTAAQLVKRWLNRE